MSGKEQRPSPPATYNTRPSALTDPYGSFLPALWLYDLRDRWRGNMASANARWGWLKPPPGRGKLVWFVCGANRGSVRLGVDLVRAVRAKRLDLRLVLTFEREHPDLLQTLAGLDKTGWGYAPCDRNSSIARAWRHFQPFGVIFAGIAPRPNFARTCSVAPHCLIVGSQPQTTVLRPEQCYPANEAQAQSWVGSPQSPVADLLTLITPAQIEPNFKSLVNGIAERNLWWWHGSNARHATEFATAFRHEFPTDILFISGIHTLGMASFKLSHWQRNAMPAGTVVLADEAKWLPAIAACSLAAHLANNDIEIFWQALAGGSAVSCADRNIAPKREMNMALTESIQREAVLRQWHEYRDNPILARNQGDAARRVFWKERRIAAEVSAELLERIFNWD